jgi:hypothetical protein
MTFRLQTDDEYYRQQREELWAGIRARFEGWPDDTRVGISRDYGWEVENELLGCYACPADYLPTYREARKAVFMHGRRGRCTRCEATDRSIAASAQQNRYVPPEEFLAELTEQRKAVLEEMRARYPQENEAASTPRQEA